jgi:hypothetical protein
MNQIKIGHTPMCLHMHHLKALIHFLPFFSTGLASCNESYNLTSVRKGLNAHYKAYLYCIGSTDLIYYGLVP